MQKAKSYLLKFKDERIYIGADKVSVEYISLSGEAVSSNHIVIYDIDLEENYILLNIGDEKESPQPGTKIRVFSNQGNFGHGYQFQSVVREVTRVKDHRGMLCWAIDIPKTIQKWQNRRTFRVDTKINAEISWVDADDDDKTYSTLVVISNMSFRGFGLKPADGNFSTDKFMRGSEHTLSFTPHSEFVECEIKRRVRGRSGEIRDAREMAAREHILESFAGIPIEIKQTLPLRTGKEGKFSLLIGASCPESDMLNRFVRFLERKMLSNKC